MSFSLCMMVKNEAGRLGRCLESVAGLAPELVVVDTGSTDDTGRVAAAFGARVIPFDFGFVDFSAARNAALAAARGRWILVLDADERVTAASLPLIRALIEKDENAGYYLERDNGTAVDHVVRLFPNRADYRYRGRVHETIDHAILAGGGKLIPTPIRLEHDFAGDREARRRKNFWYIEILKEELAANPLDDSRLDFLAAEYHQLAMFDEATAVMEEIARRRPSDARAHLFAGTYHLLYKPDFKQARRDFERALELQPDYSEAESFLRLLDSKESGAGGSQSSILLPSES
jgi:glycosyltransferase involved in cell wall biosynthesis